MSPSSIFSHPRPLQKKYEEKVKLNLAKWPRVSILRPPSDPSGKQGKEIQPKAQVAQLVEQLAFNQLVLGSSPSLRTFFQKTRPSQGGFFVSRRHHLNPKQTGARTWVRLHKFPCITGFLNLQKFRRRNSASPHGASGRAQRTLFIPGFREEETCTLAQHERVRAIPVCLLPLNEPARYKAGSPVCSISGLFDPSDI